MSRTIVRFREITKSFPSQAEAYVWVIDKFLRDKGDFFVAPTHDVKHAMRGGAGAVRFAPTYIGLRAPKLLFNGWYAETGINEQEKVAVLYLLAQSIGLSAERDYSWQGENRPTIVKQDVETMLKQLDELP